MRLRRIRRLESQVKTRRWPSRNFSRQGRYTRNAVILHPSSYHRHKESPRSARPALRRRDRLLGRTRREHGDGSDRLGFPSKFELFPRLIGAGEMGSAYQVARSRIELAGQNTVGLAVRFGLAPQIEKCEIVASQSRATIAGARGPK